MTASPKRSLNFMLSDSSRLHSNGLQAYKTTWPVGLHETMKTKQFLAAETSGFSSAQARNWINK